MTIFLIIVGCERQKSSSLDSNFAPPICNDYEIGEKRDLISRLHWPMSITRKSDKLYKVSIDLKFVPGEGYDGPHAFQRPHLNSLDKINSYYHALVARCLKQHEVIFYDNFGRKLEIELQPVRHVAIKDQREIIEIVNKGHRHDSRKYGSNIPCETVAHEVFHILGLEDEYEETVSLAPASTVASPKYLFDCRSTSTGTIMSNPSILLLNSSDDLQVLTLDCRCNADECRTPDIEEKVRAFLLAQKDPRSLRTCPLGFDNHDQKNGKVSELYISQHEKANWERSFTEYNTIEPVTKDHFAVFLGFYEYPTPLREDQMEAVLFPFCNDRYPLFRRCTRNAYRTSKESGGEGCYKVPPACRDGSWARRLFQDKKPDSPATEN